MPPPILNNDISLFRSGRAVHKKWPTLSEQIVVIALESRDCLPKFRIVFCRNYQFTKEHYEDIL